MKYFYFTIIFSFFFLSRSVTFTPDTKFIQNDSLWLDDILNPNELNPHLVFAYNISNATSFQDARVGIQYDFARVN